MLTGSNTAREKILDASELIFLSLSFYWGSVLLMKFGFMSSSGPFNVAGQGFIGSMGLLAALVVVGVAPSLIVEKRSRMIILAFSCCCGLAVGASILLQSGGGVLFF